MALSYGFFDAELTPSGQYDRAYAAEQFAEYFHLIVSNGVFPNPATQLQVVASDTPNMNVNVSDGYGWINGYYAKNSGPYPLAIQAASGTLNRIDAVVLRWVNASRSMELAVKTGIAASSPATPALQRDTDVYELMLATVTVAAGATSIPQSSITDKRSDTSVCGWVTGAVQNIDTTNLFAQYDDAFKAWFDNIKTQLGENVAANLQRQIDALSKGKVSISDKASQVEALAGTDDTKWMTPAKTKAVVGTAPETVLDLRTNKLINVITELEYVSISDSFMLLPSEVYVYSYLYWFVYNDSIKTAYMLSYLSENSTYTKSLYKAILPTQSAATLLNTYSLVDTNYITYGFNSMQVYSDDNTVALAKNLLGSGNGMGYLHFPTGTFFSRNSYYYLGWKVGDYWGDFYNKDSTFTLYYANIGSTSFKSVSMGAHLNASTANPSFVAPGHNKLWLVRVSQHNYSGSTYYPAQWQLAKVDFSSGTPQVTTGLTSYTASDKGLHSVYFRLLGYDDDYAYLMPYGKTSSSATGYKIATKVMKLSLVDGSSNWNDLTFNSDLSNELSKSSSEAPQLQLLGSIGNTVYMCTNFSKYLVSFNKNELSYVLTPTNKYASRVHYRIVDFNIPGLERYIYTNGMLLNVDTAEWQYVLWGKYEQNVNNYDLLLDKGQTVGVYNYSSNKGNRVPMLIAGTTFHSAECFGLKQADSVSTNDGIRYDLLDGKALKYKVVYREG